MSPDEILDNLLSMPLDRPDDTEIRILQRLQNAAERKSSEDLKSAILDYLKHTTEQKP